MWYEQKNSKDEEEETYFRTSCICKNSVYTLLQNLSKIWQHFADFQKVMPDFVFTVSVLLFHNFENIHDPVLSTKPKDW